ncbi:MAG: asparagine synthetase B, partial [Acidobacteriota bacterium]
MCGIAGWANLDSQKTPENGEAVLHSMCERMKHRGPDSEGLWLENEVGLGMRRLSIIDLHTGEQPVYSEDKSIVVVMN